VVDTAGRPTGRRPGIGGVGALAFRLVARRLGQFVEHGLDALLGREQAFLERQVLGAEQGVGLAQQIVLGAQRLGQLGQPVEFVCEVFELGNK
jgi:hypothetical protein